MLNTIKNTGKITTRFTATKNTVSYTLRTLSLRREKERLEKILKEETVKERKALIESEIKQITEMYEVYKDATLRAAKSALD